MKFLVIPLAFLLFWLGGLSIVSEAVQVLIVSLQASMFMWQEFNTGWLIASGCAIVLGMILAVSAMIMGFREVTR